MVECIVFFVGLYNRYSGTPIRDLALISIIFAFAEGQLLILTKYSNLVYSGTFFSKLRSYSFIYYFCKFMH